MSKPKQLKPGYRVTLCYPISHPVIKPGAVLKLDAFSPDGREAFVSRGAHSRLVSANNLVLVHRNRKKVGALKQIRVAYGQFNSGLLSAVETLLKIGYILNP